MSIKTVETITCDRCGREEVVGSSRDPWGSVLFRVGERALSNGSGDACPDCIKDAVNWWRAPQNLAAGRA